MGLLVRHYLTSLRALFITGQNWVLVPEPSPNPPEKAAGDKRGLLLSGISSSLKSPLLPAPAGRFIAFAEKEKEQFIQKLLAHLIRTKYNKIRNSKSSC